ncbi:Asp23/Gls24 family envelope stress response protein [Rhodococcus sp. SGAir0479]|uniref:Asp23/Gls24 family envelope stress response protein n=1 Tax=Rhodococcus sp. SGAir0479 TaxID=2567884 RepID=UPI0010CD622E|nr:Asp23/Gls24 family envelope stress response protein [Rhodococcus sp. SGAir0479]QCQ93604.1 Asp23/Gls24 family envelope stress response protein [Rhodococcus sp. SGAir0479]
MAEDEDIHSADAGSRGALNVDDRVARKLAEHAAATTPGVLAYSAGMDRLTGRALPRARVLSAGRRIRVHIDLAVRWGRPLPPLVRAVHDNVTTALRDYGSYHVDGIDLAVTKLRVAIDGPTDDETDDAR